MRDPANLGGQYALGGGDPVNSLDPFGEDAEGDLIKRQDTLERQLAGPKKGDKKLEAELAEVKKKLAAINQAVRAANIAKVNAEIKAELADMDARIAAEKEAVRANNASQTGTAQQQSTAQAGATQQAATSQGQAGTTSQTGRHVIGNSVTAGKATAVGALWTIPRFAATRCTLSCTVVVVDGG